MQLLRSLAVRTLIVLLALHSVAAAEGDGPYREILDGAYAADEPGAAAIVARADDVLFLGARGMANLEHGIPIDPDDVFRLGSITKQFTAAAVLMLAEEGKLSLDDPLTKFLPDYPEVGQRVSVEHLLTHTSGIVSYTGIPGYMNTEIVKALTVEELVAVFKDLPPEFEPGERFAYNNSGYVLLGAVIEQASGMSYEEYIQQKIFEPLGMTRSYYGNFTRIIPDRVSGYGPSEDGYRNARYLSMTQPYSAGSLLSTVQDMLRWNSALFGGKLVNEESLKKMITPYTLNGGESTGYAYGLGIAEVRGRQSIAHGGGINGFSTSALYLPEEKIYVAVLSNNTVLGNAPGLVATKLAAAALGDPYPVFEKTSIDEELLQGYTGVYRIDEESERIVTLVDGSLYTQRTGGPKLEAHAASDTEFFYDNTLSWFEMKRGEDGVLSMWMHQQGAQQGEEAIRVGDAPEPQAEVEIDPAVLAGHAGKFELQPGFVLTVRSDGSRLFAQATGQPEFELFATSATEFFLKVVDARVTFVVGEDGKTASLVLHQGGQEMPGKRID